MGGRCLDPLPPFGHTLISPHLSILVVTERIVLPFLRQKRWDAVSAITARQPRLKAAEGEPILRQSLLDRTRMLITARLVANLDRHTLGRNVEETPVASHARRSATISAICAVSRSSSKKAAFPCR